MNKIFKAILAIIILIIILMIVFFEMTSELKLILTLSVMVGMVLICLDHRTGSKTIKNKTR